MLERALPHFFNTAKNLDYVGPHPEPKYYGADFTSGDKRSQFLDWYEEQKDQIFHSKEELLAYCMDDVNILRQAWCAFRNLFLKLVKMDPFREAITISSICNKVFRTMFLKPDTVGIIPRGGYRLGDRQSIEALQWLAYVGRTRNNVTHVGNGKYVRQGYPVWKLLGIVKRRIRSLNNWGVFARVSLYAQSTQTHWQNWWNIAESVWGNNGEATKDKGRRL